MHIAISTLNDFNAWLALAREVEHLFGPMAEEADFHIALQQAIINQQAFCIRTLDSSALKGGVIISPDTNELLWLAVSAPYRSTGFGQSLLAHALNRLDSRQPIRVQTFDSSVPEGAPARHLYHMAGFRDARSGGNNPAGIPTVIMELAVQA